MEQLTHTDFEPYINQQFLIHYGADEPLEVELVQVSLLGREPTPEEGHRQAFALLFCSSIKDKYLIQQIYDLEHEALGRLSLFLVPLGPDTDGQQQYEAIFT